jgi:calcium-dependent protein kinase
MSKIEHPNIIHLYDIMQDSVNFFLVMDYCDKGDLLEHQKKQPQTKFSEAKAVKYLAHIRDAFLCLRNNNIMHRDIKLENLFVDKDDNLKIGDFGFAKEGLDESFTKLGSHNTMAPEIFFNIYNKEKKYNSKCDLWSIGVVFHIMLYGRKPYFCDLPKSDLNDFRKMIGSLKKFNVSNKNFEGISNESADLLRGLLRKNPIYRISISNIKINKRL